ncbi:MAG TPA: hypothetical protein VGN94_15035 [Methylobacterium sp.]|jgi:hypothetical protein|nr:hypothetical protein [Methylobacterium sp.]
MGRAERARLWHVTANEAARHADPGMLLDTRQDTPPDALRV